MPSKSEKQRRLMAMAAKPEARKKMKNPPPQAVAEEFVKADKAKAKRKKG